MADLDLANIDTTIAALEAGITTVSIAQAMTVLEAWQATASGTGDRG